MIATSVYLHFPFCAKKCPYCDFASVKIAPSAIPHQAYADAILAELEARRPELEGRRLCSIFFGGGTPSLWDPEALGRTLRGLRGAFGAEAEELEITVECNPSSLDAERAARLAGQGVGRLSLGVQSLDDARLRYLGRLHDREEALEVLEAAVARIPRLSADLIFGAPGQTVAALCAEIDRLVTTGIEHVSAYALTIEPGTRFGELHRLGRLETSTEDRYAELFEAAEARLEGHGFAHYEVSNYARAGAESRHNQHYWRGGAYLGLGAAAVGYLEEAPGRGRRWRNHGDAGRYLSIAEEPLTPARRARAFEEWEEPIGPQEIVREALMLGLRTREGVDLEATAARAGCDPLAGRERALRRR
ncbi:MAG: radical SAM family heme chaperone HemW, partial [Myxococcales bacterium]|nr:radical SAM family heme chaperone HemW [Myxococcales bacterium]